MAEDTRPLKRYNAGFKGNALDKVEEPLSTRQSSRTQSKGTVPVDLANSTEATSAFVRRILCAHHVRSGAVVEGGRGRTTPLPLEDLLPPLTTSNAVDLQLYAIIAIVIRDFVQTWYTKISPDQQFTDEIIQIIAHCTRALEQRLRLVDLHALLLDELPALLDAHVAAYRSASIGLFTTSLETNPRQIYHSIHPHPALAPIPLDANHPDSASLAIDQAENERIWRHLLVQGALAELLPPEDLQNPCLNAMVTDVFSDLILGNGICGKLCESWAIYEIIARLAEPWSANSQSASTPMSTPNPGRLERFGLLGDDDAPQHAEPSPQSRSMPYDLVLHAFWQVIRVFCMTFIGIRAFVVAISAADNLPIRTSPKPKGSAEEGYMPVGDTIPDASSSDEVNDLVADRPILGMSVWRCISHVLSLDLRMPWLTAFGSLGQWLVIYGPGTVGCTNSRLDRLISYHVSSALLDPARLPLLLHTIRTILFPNNALGPGRVPPTADQALEIKSQCASNIVDALPELVRARLFATVERAEMQSEVEKMLDVFEDSYLNKHLMFAIIDSVFLRLFPEMGQQGISDMIHAAS